MHGHLKRLTLANLMILLTLKSMIVHFTHHLYSHRVRAHSLFMLALNCDCVGLNMHADVASYL